MEISGEDGVWQDSGIWRQYRAGGDVEVEWHERDGLRDGPWVCYHESGQICLEGNYKDGVEDGIWREWSETGSLLAQFGYVDGKLDGMCEEFSDDGQLIARKSFDDGTPVGPHEEWYAGGGNKSLVMFDGYGKRVSESFWMPDGTEADAPGRATFSPQFANDLQEALRVRDSR